LVTATLLACASKDAASDAGTTYTVSSTACTLESTLKVSNEPALTWTGCAMHYDATGHVVTWQLLPGGGASGSLISPAAGAIVVSFDRDAPENTTFQLANIVSPLPASVPSGQTVFAYGTAGGRAGGTGSVAIGSNVVDPAGAGGDLSGNFAVKLTNGGTLSGDFKAAARPGGAAGSSGGSSGSSGSSGGKVCFDSSKCSALVTSCGNGGQGACYCAAACACAAACDTSCQASNSASARSTNTPCPY
jgi:hypothetical protein